MRRLWRIMNEKKAKRKKRKNKLTRAACIVAAGVVLAAVLIAMTYIAGRALDRRTYALYYAPEIIASADEYGLDRYLVAAVIHCESGNRSEVVSPKGAVGLMQIMPDTGAWIAGQLDMADYAEQRLTDPLLNIELGCWYLNFLLNRYAGNRTCALAAYNAGPGNVDKWLQDPEYSRDGELTHIPFAETEKYLDRIERAYDKYTQLYQEELG